MTDWEIFAVTVLSLVGAAALLRMTATLIARVRLQRWLKRRRRDWDGID